jgi:hypothetical protein
MKVFVYRNLAFTNDYIYSIKTLEGILKNRVVGYSPCLLLENCELVVSQAGRNRVLRTKHKNVHAGIVGDLIAVSGYKTRLCQSGIDFDFCNEETWKEKYKPGVPITYNPYLYSSFVIKGTNGAIKKANNVMIFRDQVYGYFLPNQYINEKTKPINHKHVQCS